MFLRNKFTLNVIQQEFEKYYFYKYFIHNSKQLVIIINGTLKKYSKKKSVIGIFNSRSVITLKVPI